MTHNATSNKIDDRTVDAIADEIGVDPRSIVRRLAGLPVRGRTGRRIDAALAARGIAIPLGSNSPGKVAA